MPNHLSILGIIHTAISILAIFAAVFALARYGKLSPLTLAGKLYILLTIVTCITAFPIMKTGHATAGHYVAVIVLLLLPIGIYAPTIKFLGKTADYLQIIAMSTTLFLSLIPAIVETLTRLPISSPIATGPNDPIIKTGLLTLFSLYVIGVTYQLFVLKRSKKLALQQGEVKPG